MLPKYPRYIQTCGTHPYPHTSHTYVPYRHTFGQKIETYWPCELVSGIWPVWALFPTPSRLAHIFIRPEIRAPDTCIHIFSPYIHHTSGSNINVVFTGRAFACMAQAFASGPVTQLAILDKRASQFMHPVCP